MEDRLYETLKKLFNDNKNGTIRYNLLSHVEGILEGTKSSLTIQTKLTEEFKSLGFTKFINKPNVIILNDPDKAQLKKFNQYVSKSGIKANVTPRPRTGPTRRRDSYVKPPPNLHHANPLSSLDGLKDNLFNVMGNYRKEYFKSNYKGKLDEFLDADFLDTYRREISASFESIKTIEDYVKDNPDGSGELRSLLELMESDESVLNRFDKVISERKKIIDEAGIWWGSTSKLVCFNMLMQENMNATIDILTEQYDVFSKT